MSKLKRLLVERNKRKIARLAKNVKIVFLSYRGRVITVMNNLPTVYIIGKVVNAYYDRSNKMIILVTNVTNQETGKPLNIYVFPYSFAEATLYGDSYTEEIPNGLECPAMTSLTDLVL